jgi:hypothetical protein
MAKHDLKRTTILDPAVADLLEGMEQRQNEAMLPRKQREKKARERARIQARREQRATYDLPPAVRESIKNLAEQHSLPISQLVTLALLRFFDEYKSGHIDLGQLKKPSRSPKYEWVLDLESMLETFSVKKKRSS